MSGYGYPASRITDPVSHDDEQASGTISKPVPHPKPVLVEKKLAAPITSEVTCSGKKKVGIDHPPPPSGGPGPIVVVGAETVLINGKPASRWFPSGDVISCGAWGGSPDPGAPRTVKIGGPTTTEAACKELEALLKLRIAELERWNAADQARFKKWFGKADEKTRKEMLKRMKKMQKLLKNYDKNNFISWTPTKDDNKYGFYAQVDSDDDQTIELANKFATAPKSGANSRAGVVAHEMSHFKSVGDTDDVDSPDGETAYGKKRSRELAKKTPDKAVKNADNFEYWIEGQ